MKKYYLIFAFALLISCSDESNTNHVVNNTGQPGYLKTITVQHPDTGETLNTLEYFYTGNRLQNKISYSATDEVQWMATYEYDNDLITNIKFWLPNDDTPYQEQIFTYDNQSRLTQEQFLRYNSSSANSTRATYNHIDNNEIEYRVYTGDYVEQNTLESENIITLNNDNEVMNIRSSNQPVENPFVAWTYDDKAAPLANIVGFNKFYMNFDFAETKAHNPTSQTISSDTAISYVYNASNKPVMAFYDYNNGETIAPVKFSYFE